MKWHDVNVWTWRYVDAEGRICGEVFKSGHADYHATMGKRDLGRFIDVESAQNAVEDCHRNPRLLEHLRSTGDGGTR